MGFWHGITSITSCTACITACCWRLRAHPAQVGFYKKHRRERWFKICSWAVTMIAVFYGFALFSGQVFHNPL